MPAGACRPGLLPSGHLFFLVLVCVRDLLFHIVGGLTLVGAVGAVTLRRTSHVAFALLVVVFGVAGIQALCGALVPAVVEALVMGGGVGLILYRGRRRAYAGGSGSDAKPSGLLRFATTIVCVALASVLLAVVWGVPQWRDAEPIEAAGGGGDPAAVAGTLVNDAVVPMAMCAVGIAIASLILALRARRSHQAEAATDQL